MNQNSQLKAGVIISYITTAVNIIINLIYTPLLTSLLGQSEYGLYTVVASVVNYLSLFSLGFGSAYLRYFSRYRERREQEKIYRLNGMFLLVFTFLAVCAFLTGIFLVKNAGLVLGDKITPEELHTAQLLMFVLVVNIVLTFPSGVFNSIIVAHECYIFQRGFNLLSRIMNPIIVLPLLLAGYKSVAVVSVTALLTTLNFLINAVYCFRRLHSKFYFRKLDFRILKDIGRFSFFVFLNMIIDQINWSVDKFLLIRFSGTAAVAVYGIASQVNSLYLSFSTQISSVFEPRVNQIVAKEEQDRDSQLTCLFTRVGRIQFIIMTLILMGLITFGEYFIELWVGKAYEGAYPVILLLIIPVTVPLVQNLGIEIQRAKNSHQFRSLVYLLVALGNVLVSIPLTKKYGPVGSALGTSLSLIIGNCLIMNFYYHFKLGINMCVFWKNIVSFIPGIVPSILLGIAIKKWIVFSSLLQYLAVILLFIVIYCFFMWKFGMNEQEKDIVRSLAARLKCRNKVQRK